MILVGSATISGLVGTTPTRLDGGKVAPSWARRGGKFEMGMSWASEYISTMFKHFICIYAVCTVFPGGQKKSLDPQEVELQAAV